MKSYIFACNYETMGECQSRNLFGVAKPNVSDISEAVLVKFPPGEDFLSQVESRLSRVAKEMGSLTGLQFSVRNHCLSRRSERCQIRN